MYYVGRSKYYVETSMSDAVKAVSDAAAATCAGAARMSYESRPQGFFGKRMWGFAERKTDGDGGRRHLHLSEPLVHAVAIGTPEPGYVAETPSAGEGGGK